MEKNIFRMTSENLIPEGVSDLLSEARNKMVMEYNKKLEEVIQEKLKQLIMDALHNNEFEFYEIAKDISSDNFKQINEKLLDSGYTLEVIQPEPIFTTEDSTIKMTAEVDKIKVRVRKTILEV